jgi:flagellin
MAMNTHRQLSINNGQGSKSIEKLSSGQRINRAGDDAAGLAISEKMRAQIRGLGQASRNAQDGISLVQTAEGALNETQAILQRMRELAVQSANDTNADTDRSALQNEVDQLALEITRISNNTEFNERKLLNGGLQSGNLGELSFHIGANANQNMQLGVRAMDAFSLGVAGLATNATLAGTGDVTAVAVTGNAAAVVDGNVVTITTVLVPGSPAQNVNVGLGNSGLGFTVIADGGNVAGNGYLISFVNDTTESITVNHDAKTIVVTGDISDPPPAPPTATGPPSDPSTWVPIVTGTNPGFNFSFGGSWAGIFVYAAAAHTYGGALATPDTYTVNFNSVSGGSVNVTGLAANATSVTGSGTYAGFSLTLDGGLADAQSNTITLAVTSANAAAFVGGVTVAASVQSGLNISTQIAANAAITIINSAIGKVSEERAKLGVVQNRLEHTIKNLDTSAENLQASESRIRDVDMAKEMMNFTKNNILQQAAQAMLAQANQAPQGVLQLLS